MALITISVDRDKLPKHSKVEFEEWIKYQVGSIGGISLKNPLHDIDLESQVREISS